jgi:hypothetical protein
MKNEELFASAVVMFLMLNFDGAILQVTVLAGLQY